jgi:hypothetical protein
MRNQSRIAEDLAIHPPSMKISIYAVGRENFELDKVLSLDSRPRARIDGSKMFENDMFLINKNDMFLINSSKDRDSCKQNIPSGIIFDNLRPQ